MKKSLLALAVAALAASSVSATTVYDKDGTSLGVYGRVQSVFYSGKASGVSDESASFNTSARFGVDLRSQLTQGVAAFAKAEWEASNGNNVVDETGDNFYARYLWVGLDFGSMGQVKVGKFEEAIKYAISPTDVFDDWGCTGLAGNDDRRESAIMYQWSGAGFDALASFALAKDNEHLDGAYFASNGNDGEIVDLDYSWSLAVGYTTPDVIFGPIAVRAGYASGYFADKFSSASQPGEKNNDKNIVGFGGLSYNAHYDSYDQYAISASWGKLNIGPYVAVAYQIRSFDVNPLTGYNVNYDYDVAGWEFAAGYSFANGITVRTGYMTQNVDVENTTVDVTAATVPIYVNWQLNPQFNVWAEARFDAGTDDNENDSTKHFDAVVGTNYAENVYSAGLRYTF